MLWIDSNITVHTAEKEEEETSSYFLPRCLFDHRNKAFVEHTMSLSMFRWPLKDRVCSNDDTDFDFSSILERSSFEECCTRDSGMFTQQKCFALLRIFFEIHDFYCVCWRGQGRTDERREGKNIIWENAKWRQKNSSMSIVNDRCALMLIDECWSTTKNV